MKKTGPLREGRVKVLDSETGSWTGALLTLTMADDDSGTFLLVVRPDDRPGTTTVALDKSCRFLADAAKVTGSQNTFTLSKASGGDLAVRAEESEYKRWVTDIGRAKMASSGLSTAPASLGGFGSIFNRSASKSNVGASPLAAAFSSTPVSLPGSGNSSGSSSSSALPTTPSKSGSGGTFHREFAGKIGEIVKLEEQLARKRVEAMHVLSLIETSDDPNALLQQPPSPHSKKADSGGPMAIRKSTSTMVAAAAAPPSQARIDAYRGALQRENHKRVMANAEWSGGTGELTLVVGDLLQIWYSNAAAGWAFGALLSTKDGKDTMGWFPLSIVKPLDELEPRARAQSISNAASLQAAAMPVPQTPSAEVKKLDLEGFAVKVFNMKAKKGIKWIKEQLYKGASEMNDAEADVSIGHFLWDHRKELSKEELGDLFGEDTEEAKRIYNAFVSKFVVVGLDLDLALRRLLYLFKLPGEAQKIDRIMKVFSQHYYDSNCGPDSPLPLVREALKSPKEAYTLVFALIMLNTDAHTESLPKHMTCQEFMDNIRYSTKEGIFIDNEYLSDMYWRIVNEEIKMQDAARFPFASRKGHLELRLGPFWAKRWIILSDGRLIICKSVAHEDEPQLVVPAASTLVDDSITDAPLTFVVGTPVTKLRFRAKSDRERLQWLAALARERDVVVEEESSTTSAVGATTTTGGHLSARGDVEESRSELFGTPMTPGIQRRPSVSTSDLRRQIDVNASSSSTSSPPHTPLAATSAPALPVVSVKSAAVTALASGAAGGGAAEVAASEARTPAALPSLQLSDNIPRSPRSGGRSPRGGGGSSKSPRRRKKKTLPAGKKRRKRDKVVALYDVVAPIGSSRISVSAGEVLLLIQRTNQQWHKVQSHAGVTGYLPASYMTLHISGISSLEPPPQPPMPEEDFTRAAFVPQESTELPSLLSPRTAHIELADEEDEEEEKTEGF